MNDSESLHPTGEVHNHVWSLRASLVHELEGFGRTGFHAEKHHPATTLGHLAPRPIAVMHHGIGTRLTPPCEALTGQSFRYFVRAFFSYEEIVINEFNRIYPIRRAQPENIVDHLVSVPPNPTAFVHTGYCTKTAQKRATVAGVIDSGS